MYRFETMLAVAVSLWCLFNLVSAYPKGAPTSVCHSLVPSPRAHKASPMDKKSPYTLDIHVDKDKLQLKVIY